MQRRDFLTLLPCGALAAAGFASRASAQPAPALNEVYHETAARLIGAALTDDGGWKKLEFLCDRIGPRIDGSAALARAVAWAAEEMRREGLNVRTIPAKIPHWVRGEESLRMIEPELSSLVMLGLGGSVGTPREGITAEVVSVANFDELEALGAEKVRGRIVLYNVPYAGYGRTVVYRTQGAARAAKLGAVASLVRSVASATLRTPHTGKMDYDAAVPKIPHAAIAIEDALRIQRLLDAGNRVRLCLTMGAQTLEAADSADILGEVPGRERPEEIVLLGGHIDSWDVGTGAQDDGSGAMACWQAVTLIHQLGLQPRRTIRVVLWTDEEQTGAGAAAYRQWADAALSNHVAAIEMDGGAERTVGFGLALPRASDAAARRALARMKQIGVLLKGIDAGEMSVGGGGADIAPLMKEGVPGIAHRSSGQHYFDWHHSPADTLDKIDPRDFRVATAALAVLIYVLADMPGRLDA
jgi:hypothetical protein